MTTHKVLASIIAFTGMFAATGAVLADTNPNSMNNGSMNGGSMNQMNQGQSSQTTYGQSEQYKNLSDRDFVMKAAQSNMAEIKLSQLALNKTSNSSVRQYAQKMIDDHTSVGQELMQIVSSKGISLPMTMDLDSMHQSTYNRLQSLNGSDFDQAYLNAMVQDHSNAVFLFQAQAQQGQDPELKAFASRKLPAFQSHLAMSQSLTAVANNSVGQSDVNPSSSSSTSSSTTYNNSTSSSSQAGQTNTTTTTDSQAQNTTTSEPIPARW